MESILEAMLAVGPSAAMLTVHAQGGVGGVFVDAGRVCWAAVPQTRRYLSDRLEEAGVAASVLTQFIAEAKTSGRPLGELLVERQVMSADAFRLALFEHSVASMVEMVSSPIRTITTSARQSGSFSVTHSFESLHFMAEVGYRLFSPGWLPPLKRVSADLTALAVVKREDHLFPVRCVSEQPRDLRSGVELAVDGGEVMSKLDGGSVSFRRGNKCWAVSGTPADFVVSEGESPLSFSWMLMQQP